MMKISRVWLILLFFDVRTARGVYVRMCHNYVGTVLLTSGSVPVVLYLLIVCSSSLWYRYYRTYY